MKVKYIMEMELRDKVVWCKAKRRRTIEATIATFQNSRDDDFLLRGPKRAWVDGSAGKMAQTDDELH